MCNCATNCESIRGFAQIEIVLLVNLFTAGVLRLRSPGQFIRWHPHEILPLQHKHNPTSNLWLPLPRYVRVAQTPALFGSWWLLLRRLGCRTLGIVTTKAVETLLRSFVCISNRAAVCSCFAPAECPYAVWTRYHLGDSPPAFPARPDIRLVEGNHEPRFPSSSTHSDPRRGPDTCHSFTGICPFPV